MTYKLTDEEREFVLLARELGRIRAALPDDQRVLLDSPKFNGPIGQFGEDDTNELPAIRPPIDHNTAKAFARSAFDKLHPADTLPHRFWRFATASIKREQDSDFYLVGFAWKKRSARYAEQFFCARVNILNAETEVLLDTSLEEYRQDELEEYL
jgi:hypothetical protein